jgi:hypothetical protein
MSVTIWTERSDDASDAFKIASVRSVADLILLIGGISVIGALGVTTTACCGNLTDLRKPEISSPGRQVTF